ncbi:hypothetical protein MKW94_028614, partial [Papaver nudicaule]|nr:hypothetical protein [Papaver nudicaule]
SVKRPRVPRSDIDTDHKIMSSSKSIYETVEGSHEYKIEGYSLAKGMGVGKSMTSGRFTVGGYEWVIHFYPDGYDQANVEYVSVFASFVSPGEARALFELKLLDQGGNRIHGLHPRSSQTFNTKNG